MTAMRVPPNALDAERATLGGLLLERDAMDAVVDILPDHELFYSDANGRIYEAMQALTARSQPIDHTTLRAELARSGRLAAIGGDEYLFSLTNTLPSVENIEAHAGIVREKARVRALITACHEIASTGYGDYGDPAAFFDRAEASIFALAGSETRRSGPEVVDPAELMREIQDVASGKIDPSGLTTGIASLDRLTDGTFPGDLIVIGGATGQGKSSIAMGAGWAGAEASRDPCLMFSLEMQMPICKRRLLSMVADVDSKLIRKGRLTNDDWTKIARASKRIADTKFIIDADPGLTIDQIRSRSRRVAAKHGKISSIIVDYLQIMGESGSSNRAREREVAAMSGGLKRLAKELNTRVFALSQLNRGVDDRPDKWPQISDLRESGAIEQDADMIWMPYRPGYYAAQMSKDMTQSKYGRAKSTIQPGEDDGRAKIIVAKQRSGSPGVIDVMFDGPSTRFYDPHQPKPETRVRGNEPHYTEGRPDDSDGDGFNDDERWST